MIQTTHVNGSVAIGYKGLKGSFMYGATITVHDGDKRESIIISHDMFTELDDAIRFMIPLYVKGGVADIAGISNHFLSSDFMRKYPVCGTPHDSSHLKAVYVHILAVNVVPRLNEYCEDSLSSSNNEVADYVCINEVGIDNHKEAFTEFASRNNIETKDGVAELRRRVKERHSLPINKRPQPLPRSKHGGEVPRKTFCTLSDEELEAKEIEDAIEEYEKTIRKEIFKYDE